MVVVLPAPFGPSRPTSSPSSHLEVDAVECGEVAEALDEALGDDSLHARQHTGTAIAITIFPGAGSVPGREAGGGGRPLGARMRHDRTRDTRRRARLRRRAALARRPALVLRLLPGRGVRGRHRRQARAHLRGAGAAVGARLAARRPDARRLDARRAGLPLRADGKLELHAEHHAPRDPLQRHGGGRRRHRVRGPLRLPVLRRAERATAQLVDHRRATRRHRVDRRDRDRLPERLRDHARRLHAHRRRDRGTALQTRSPSNPTARCAPRTVGCGRRCRAPRRMAARSTRAAGSGSPTRRPGRCSASSKAARSRT